MAWLIGTTSAKRQFYVFNDYDGSVIGLVDSWDHSEVTQFDDKQAAKQAAKKAGLKTWTYVDLNYKPRNPR